MFSTLLPKLISLTSKAGDTIMTMHNENMSFIVKSDKTPLTQADKISHNLITETLKKLIQVFQYCQKSLKTFPFLFVRIGMHIG